MNVLATAALAGLFLWSTTQAETYETRFKGTTWDNANWRIRTTSLDQGHYQSRMSLSNGYLGINLAAVGPFFEVDSPVNGDDISGWPLFNRRQTFATIAGFYDSQPTTNGTNFEWLNQYGGESVISGVPHWAGLHVKVGDDVLDAGVSAKQISGFSSTLDMKAGLMQWAYTWSPSKNVDIDVEYSMLVHKSHVNQAAVQLKLKSRGGDANVTVIDALNGDCAVRTDFVRKQFEANDPIIWSAVRPDGIDNVTAYIYSEMVADKSSAMNNKRYQFTDESVIGANRSSVAQAMDVSLKAGQTARFTKYIGGASTDAFDDPQNVALSACRSAAKSGFRSLMTSHKKEWRSIMPDDSVDNYSVPSSSKGDASLPKDTDIIEQQILAVTNPFNLLQNTVGTNAIAAANNNPNLDVSSIAVGGLGSDSYAGFIFWDAEVWMAPGLVVAFPEAAKQIAQYRVEKFAQARRNIKTAYQSSQNQSGKFASTGAVFPWTSGRFGNCTGTGPCFDYEYHINGDIGLELYNYYAVTGDEDYFRNELFPIYDAVAQFYSDLVTLNKNSGKYNLFNATDPDEYANFKTDVGYTMVLMRTHIDMANSLRSRFGMSKSAPWSDIASSINVPIDKQADIILEYQGMNGSIQVKQADVVLIDDFLDYPNPYTQSDLAYYAGKQSPNGPGMTYGVFSIIENTNSSSGCASYTYDLYSAQPYVRAPWFQFSEQLIDDYTLNGGTHPAYPFLTGMGGANRVAVFGYLGLKLMLESLNVNPSLPPQIPHLEYRTIYWQGWPIKAISNQTHTTLTRLSNKRALENANSDYANSPIPVTVGIAQSSSSSSKYSLQPNGVTITIPNRRVAENKTIPGNIAQCRPASSRQNTEPGQFALSAVDGSDATKWQPVHSDSESTLIVSLTGEQTDDDDDGATFVPVTGLRFDWAQAPPDSYSVTFSNRSSLHHHHDEEGNDDDDEDEDNAVNDDVDDDENGRRKHRQVHVHSDNNVKISNPWDPKTVDDVTAYTSNTTNVTLDQPVWSGRFAILRISGNQALGGNSNKKKSGVGATVAEFAIVAAGDHDHR